MLYTNNPCTAEALSSEPSHRDPFSLIGRRCLHRFIVDCGEEWFDGVILSYNATNNTHELVYENEEHQYFDKTEDILNGDIKLNLLCIVYTLDLYNLS